MLPHNSTKPLKAVPLQCLVLALFLEMRWYDKQWDKWTEWEEVEGFKLREKYGATPEEWKTSCKAWIEVGGHYEYRIGTRTDVVEWEISYRENAKDQTP